MPYLDKVVNHINTRLNAEVLMKSSKFAGSKLHGIAFTIPEISSAGTKWLPAVVDESGEMCTVVPDDRYPVRIYHRVNSASPQGANVSQYGDGLKMLSDSYNCSMIVHGFRDKIKMDVYALEALLISAMPSELSAAMKSDYKVKQCTIRIQERQYDPFKLWVDEYRSLDEIGLKINSLFFRINYQVQQIYDKSCISICDNC